MKKFVLLLCVVAVFMAMTSLVTAESIATGTCGENGEHLSWILDGTGVLTISGSGRMMDYSADASNPAPWHELRGSIQQIVLGEHVTGIGSHAFEDCTLLQNVSNTVDRYALRYVGDCAFRNCTALTGFCLDSTGVDSFQCSLDTIGAYAFQNTGITYADISYTGSVGEGAFADCTSLTSVVFSNKCSDIPAKMLYQSGIANAVFPPAVRSIGEEAFANSEQLSVITLNDGLRTIGRHAFSECTALTSVAIPQSVKAIADSEAEDDFAFSGVGTNIQFTVYDGTPIQSYASAHGNLMPNVTIIQPEFVLDSNDVLTAYNGSDTKVTVPVYVSAIGENAFQNNPSVAEVVLPENITSIGSGAFSGCTALTTINLDKVTQIGDAAFEGCSSLATIAVGESWEMKNWLENAETIGSRAFAQCTALTAVELGSRVSFQEDSFETGVEFRIAYNNETALAKAESLQLDYMRYCENPAFAVDEEMTLIAYTSGYSSNITLPLPIRAIGDDAFRGHSFTEGAAITIHSPIAFIGDYAFSDISAGVFYAYSSSEEGNVNNFENLTSIGEGAFLNNTGIRSFTIPASVTSIGQNAFDKEEDTLSVHYGSEGYNWVRTNEYTYKVLWPEGFTADNDGVLTAYSGSAANVEIPEGITVISEQVFKDHAEIEHVSIPSTVKSIGASAFEGCTALSALDIPNSVETIGERALAECTMLSSVTLPEGLTAIAKEVFHNDTALTGITLPSGLVSIGEGAFYHTGLTAVEFPANLQTIGKSAFYNSKLTTVTIPDSVMRLGETAFSGCGSLESITFGSGATTLPLGVAGTCNALSSVTIPEGVTTIKEFAFHGNRQMTELELPSTVTTIVQNALGMTGIRTLVLPDGITSIQNAFADMRALMDVYVPEGYDATDFYSKTMLNSGARVHMQIGSTAARTIGQAFAPTDEGYEGLLVQHPDGGTDGLILAGTYKQFTELVLPAGITAVGNAAFLNHASLESVILNEGIKTIGDRAFEGTQLHTVILPGSVAKIGDAAFLNNPLNDVSFAENGSLNEIGADAFRNTELSEANLPEGLRRIGNRAFLECEGLSVVTLPQTLEEIGEQAFQGSMIANVTLPDRLASIGFSAFEGTQLSGDITIPASVTDLGGNAFANTGVTAVYFMGAQTELGGPVAGAETVIYAATVSATAKSISKYHDSFVDMNDTEWTYVWAFQNTGENWKSSYTDAYNGAPAQYKDRELLVALAYRGTDQASLTILNEVGVLGEELLANHMEITDVQLPESLRIVDRKAFSHAEYLTGIALPNGTLSLGERAFEHCKAMKTVTLPDSLNRLSDYTFDGCLQVPGIILPDNMTYVGNSALGEADVKGARTFTVNIDSNTVKLLGNYDFFYDRQHPEYRYRWISDYDNVYDPNTGNYYTVDRGGLELNRYLGTAAEIVVDSRVIGIGDYAFCWYNNSTGIYTYNTTLEKITFPEGMRYIRSYAFLQATKLKEVSLPGTLETIGYSTFEYCPIEALTIPESVTVIESHAFNGTKIAEVTLKNDGISIGDYAFSLPTLVYCGLDSNTAHRLSNSHVPFVANDLDDDHILLQDCALRYISADDGTETLRLMGYYGEQKFFKLYDKIESVSSSVELNGARILADLDSHEAWVASFSNGDENDWSTYGFTTSETDEFNYAMTGEGTAGIVAYHGTSNYIDAFPEFVNGFIRMPFDYTNTDYNSANPIILAFKPESREGKMLQSLDCYFRDPDDTGIAMTWQTEGSDNVRTATVVKYIGEEGNVTIPEGVKGIQEYAFGIWNAESGWYTDNANVKSITLPASMNQVSQYNLAFLPELQSVTFMGHLDSFSGGGFSYSDKLTSVHFTQGVGRIGDYAFSGFSALAEVTGLEQISYIGSHAFSGTALSSVSFENDIELGDGAFSNSHKLIEVTFNEHVASVPVSCFSDSERLTSVHFLKDVDRIENSAFANCTSLAEVTGLEQSSYVGENAFYNTGLQSLAFAKSVNIGQSAFSHNHNLAEVTFNAYVDRIPSYCFSDSEKLVSVSFAEGVGRVDDNAFASCTALTNVAGVEQAEYVGSGAFSYTGLHTITLADNVEIGSSAFYEDTKLTEISFLGNVKRIGNSAFYNTAFTSLHIPGDAGVLEGYSIYTIPNLKSVEIDGNIQKIDQYGLENNYQLTSFVVHGSIGTISSYAIDNLQNLKTIEIDGDIDHIAEYGIYNNPQLESFSVLGSIGTIASNGLYVTSRLQNIVLGEGTKELSSSAIRYDYYPGWVDLYLPASLTSIADDAVTYYETPLNDMFRFHAPVDSYAAHWASEKFGVFYSENLGYTYDANNALVLIRYKGSEKTAAPYAGITSVDNSAGELSNVRLIATVGSDLAQKISAAGINFTTDAESAWDYRYVDGKLYGVIYHGNEKEITSVPAYMEGILPGALTDDIRIICDRNTPLAHMAEGFYEPSQTDWKLRWNGTTLTLVYYIGEEKEITAFPEGIEAIDDGAFPGEIKLICDRDTSMAHLVDVFYEPAYKDWMLRWNGTTLTLVQYIGEEKEITSFPEGLGAVEEWAFYDDVRIICDRNSSMAHMVYGFYETASSEWKLRWNDSVLTLVRYTGSETEITAFPEGVTSVDAGAFDGEISFVCDADSTMAKAVGAVGYSFYTDHEHSFQMLWSGEELTLQNGAKAAGDVTIPEGTTRIAFSAFRNNSDITGVTIPSSVKVIERDAFYGCGSLKNVNLNEGLLEIEYNAFANISSLNELHVPESVTKIGSWIYNTGKLYLPDNITECGEHDSYNVFVHADSVTARALGDGKSKSNYDYARFCDLDDNYMYAWLDGKLYLMGYRDDAANRSMFRNDIYGIKDGYEYAHYLKTIILPSSVRDLWSVSGDRFFGDQTQSITFPEGLTVIPSGTDTYENLNTVVIPRSVTTIDDNAFGAGLMTVYGYAGTEAEVYADRKGINFVDLDGEIEDDAVISPDMQNTVLHVGETVNIHDLVTVYPALSTPYPLSASCSDSNILKVQGDQVTASAPGTATLNVWITDHEITETGISVTIYNPVADFEVPEDGYIDINNGGKTFSVTNVTPSGYDPNFIWKDTTGNEYGTGESAWISLYSKVQRTISVTSHNGISKTFRLIGYQTLGNLTLDTVEQMIVGQTATPTVKIRVDGTTRTNPKELYTLTSSDETVISIGANGVIHAVGSGTATVTAQHVQDMDGSKAKSVTITVMQSMALRLPAALKVIDEEAFEGISAESVIIPSGVTTIASRAFANSHISLAVIPASVTSIANDAFAGVSNLTIQCESGSAAEAFAQANGYQIIH